MSPLGLEPPGTGTSIGDPIAPVYGSEVAAIMGVDNVIEIGGVYLNVRGNIDTYMVNEIGGLDDPELRDDREVNPQAHGETAFNAYYGGRTITLTGYVRAFSLEKLRDMTQALKQAIVGLEGEQALIFHKLSDSSRDMQIFVRKGAPLQMAEAQTDHNYFRRPFMITLRASNPRFMGMEDQYTTAYFGFIEDFSTNLNNYDLTAAPTISSGQLAPASTSAARVLRKDNTGWVNDSDTEQVYKYTPNNTTMTSSVVGIIAKYIDANNFIHGQIDAAGVVTIRKRDGGTPSTLQTGSTAAARTATGFWVRLRTSLNVVTFEHFTVDPRANPAATPNATVTHTLTAGNATKFGTGITGRVGMDFTPNNTSWRFDDYSAVTYNASASDLMTVTNIGNFPALPEFTFSNKMTGVSLSNSASNLQFSLEMDLLGGETRTLNTSGWTLKDLSGNNKFSELGITSDWVEINPGENDLVMSATGMQITYAGSTWQIPQVSVKHRHSWF